MSHLVGYAAFQHGARVLSISILSELNKDALGFSKRRLVVLNEIGPS